MLLAKRVRVVTVPVILALLPWNPHSRNKAHTQLESGYYYTQIIVAAATVFQLLIKAGKTIWQYREARIRADERAEARRQLSQFQHAVDEQLRAMREHLNRQDGQISAQAERIAALQARLQ